MARGGFEYTPDGLIDFLAAFLEVGSNHLFITEHELLFHDGSDSKGSDVGVDHEGSMHDTHRTIRSDAWISQRGSGDTDQPRAAAWTRGRTYR